MSVGTGFNGRYMEQRNESGLFSHRSPTTLANVEAIFHTQNELGMANFISIATAGDDAKGFKRAAGEKFFNGIKRHARIVVIARCSVNSRQNPLLSLPAQQHGQESLLEMQPVFRFLKNHALRAVDHVIGDFDAAIGG